MADESRAPHQLRPSATPLHHWIAAFTTGTLLLAAWLTQLFIIPLYSTFLGNLQEGTVPWFARVATAALHPAVLGLLTVGLLVYGWWQQPVMQARGVAPWLRRWPLLPAVNLFLVVAILGESTAIVDFARVGLDKMVTAPQLANGGRAHIPKSVEELHRFQSLPRLAKESFMRGDFLNARDEAKEVLDAAPRFADDGSYGQAIHDGNMVLGRIALKNGDRSEAIRHLKAAGNTPGGGVLNYFGPNMSLAHDLLTAGEREAVLDYFVEIRAFWRDYYERLPQWETEVRRGIIPEFRANLVY